MSDHLNALVLMAERPPVHCIFAHKRTCFITNLKMPLVYTLDELHYLQSVIQRKAKIGIQKKAVSHSNVSDPTLLGTRMMDLEIWLRKQFDITGSESVFGVIPADELYSPPIPFTMVNTIVARLLENYEEERTPVLHFQLAVKETLLLNQPVPTVPPDSPFHPVLVDQLGTNANPGIRARATEKIIRNLSDYGFVRLEVSEEMASALQNAYQMTRKWLTRQRELPKREQWRDLVDARTHHYKETTIPLVQNLHARNQSMVSRGRYVGYSSDSSRDYIQLRHPIHKSGTKWPHAYFSRTEDGCNYALEMLKILRSLDELARVCLLAVCETMKLDTKYIFAELLDDVSLPENMVLANTTDEAYQYGASVLRIYDYRNKAPISSSQPLVANDSCGVHADLGLLTISPTATIAGLQIWSLERMLWTDIESGAEAKHVSLFAGETLGYLTNGRLPGTLHRVPAIYGSGDGPRRMSMPYFLRSRPEKVLNPTAKTSLQLTCRDFMEDIVFKKRPWRRVYKANQLPPDY